MVFSKLNILKKIPEEIYHRAQAAAENSLRSLNPEIISRLRRSFDLEAARTSAHIECNYGEAGIPLDKWFGTFRDGLPDGVGAKLKEEHK